jgi:hypothetical protein
MRADVTAGGIDAGAAFAEETVNPMTATRCRACNDENIWAFEMCVGDRATIGSIDLDRASSG